MTNIPSQATAIQFQGFISVSANIQRLTVKAFSSKNLQNLIFIILNDTYQIVKYDRAILFRKMAGRVNILGISGQATFNLQTEMSSRLKELILNLNDSDRQRILYATDFSSQNQWDYLQAQKPSVVFWMPIITDNEEIGLWLERYDDPDAKKNFEAYHTLLKDSLAPAYAAAWEKLSPHFSLHKLLSHINFKKTRYFLLGLLILLYLIPVRMRVTAPCEVIPDKPYVATAPMDGVIDYVAVLPGEKINKDQLIFQYDKKIPEYRYKSALEDFEVTQAEWNRAYTLGTEKKEESSKLAILDYKKKSAEAVLDFAKKQMNFIINYSPVNGLVSVDDPTYWRGRPVKTGEKIMEISNPEQTKLRIWIPTKDAISFDLKKPVKVFLNPIPHKTFMANLIYVTPEIKISEDQIPSLEGEAHWIDRDNQPKLGLKGYAFVYGERVSILYFLLHKPITMIRTWLA